MPIIRYKIHGNAAFPISPHEQAMMLALLEISGAISVEKLHERLEGMGVPFSKTTVRKHISVMKVRGILEDAGIDTERRTKFYSYSVQGYILALLLQNYVLVPEEKFKTWQVNKE